LIDNTLIIFTSDHGELLGEYGGLTYHNRPPCPELVYVPTVFINPIIKPQKINNYILRHVDLCPTIASIIKKKIPYEMDGVDITSNLPPSFGLNFRFGGYFKSNSKIEKMFTYQASSVWDYDGGNIFHGLGKYRALFFFIFKILIQHHPRFNYMREFCKKNPSKKISCYKDALFHFSSPYIKYLNPQISKSSAKKIIDEYLNESVEFKEKILIKSAISKLIKKIN
jgi:hypothetical protein